MKIILAPDKFKGTLTSPQVAEIEERAIRTVLPDAEIVRIPLADGGDGTVQALTAALGGTFETVSVRDPLGRPVDAIFGMAGKCAVLEMAAASGMVLLSEEERNPMNTTTSGTGDLIRHALSSGAEEIVIGIGGSATVDGGAGMAEALGYRFFDASGREIKKLCGGNLREIAEITAEQVPGTLKRCRIRIASDVRNPLLGDNGAVSVFSPQKGATPEMMPILEQGLSNLRSVLLRQGWVAGDLPGDGAAGGLGFGLRAFCGAVPESGARLAISLSGMEEKIRGTDLVVTGEGCSDSQTGNGKLCSEVAAFCARHGVPCVLLSGKITENPGPLFEDSVATVPPEKPFAEIRGHAEDFLFRAAKNFAEKRFSGA